jgi:hypothetical protein
MYGQTIVAIMVFSLQCPEDCRLYYYSIMYGGHNYYSSSAYNPKR